MELSGKRVLVTGATGLLGGATVEQLTRRGDLTVRILARDADKVRRFAGLSLEIVVGDITDKTCVQRAVAGCNVVIHSVMAKGGADARLVNVEGTRHVLDAAVKAGVKRVVHISSAVVYLPWPDGVVDESFPRRSDGTRTSYQHTKWESEELALSYYRQHGLSVVVVQPVGVYGPRAAAWTVNVLQQLKRTNVLLMDGDTAFHNFVYVDDEARGIILWAMADGVEGEIFIIGGGERIITRDFYAAYERMLSLRAVASVDRAELASMDDLAVLARRRGLPADRPVVAVSNFATRTLFSIEKARHRLGYEPAVNFQRGIACTEDWARSASLLEV